jgi:hypothetical protein
MLLKFSPRSNILMSRIKKKMVHLIIIQRIDKDDFLTRAQPDLQLAYTLIQQSQEIALKAKICAVS